MIYGNKDGLFLIVGAADTISEYQTFYKNVIESDGVGFIQCTQPDFMEMISDNRFRGFKEAPYVFEFASIELQSYFLHIHQIHACPLYYIADKQTEMLKPTKDPFFTDKTPLGEVYGLNERDPWDSRTEEQKEKDAEHKKSANASKKEGGLTGDTSFDFKTEKVQVRRVDVTQNEDKTYDVKEILAVKGLFDKDEVEIETPKTHRLDVLPIENMGHVYRDFPEIKSHLKEDDDGNFILDEVLAHRLCLYLRSINTEVKLFEDNCEIEPNEDVAQRVFKAKDKIYFRVNVDSTLFLATQYFGNAINDKIVDRGQIGKACWFIFNAKTTAMLVQVQLETRPFDNVFKTEIYPVNVDGERLVPKGIELHEEEEFVEPPRLWNERAAEITTMTEEQLAENKKSISGKEFYFSGSYIDAQVGCIMYVTPKSYFLRTDSFWKGDLGISELLPVDLKLIAPGIYQTRSREWMNLYHDMISREFTESMGFQLYMNSMI
jgi:hypothetical protein